MIYAIVENGTVANLVLWDGDTNNWQPPEGTAAVLVAEGASVCIGDGFDGTAFVPALLPPEPTPEPLTAEQTLAQRDALLAAAAIRIAPLQDAADLEVATAAEAAALKAWKQYRVALSRIEQQSGFPASVVWPDAPQ